MAMGNINGTFAIRYKKRYNDTAIQGPEPGTGTWNRNLEPEPGTGTWNRA